MIGEERVDKVNRTTVGISSSHTKRRSTDPLGLEKCGIILSPAIFNYIGTQFWYSYMTTGRVV